jgi:HJR/Mrr/RecB family endonuclease
MAAITGDDWIILSTFAALIIGLVFGGRIFDRCSEWRNSWTRCRHGVPGGRMRQLCAACVRDQQIAEQELRKAEEAVKLLKRLNASAVEMQQKEAIRLTQSLVLSLKELRRLTPQRFEDEIANMYNRLGYTVEQTPYSNDYGRDAILQKDGEKFLLECKRYGEGVVVGRPELQKFHSAIMSDQAKLGFFVTTGTFSEGAIEFATTVPIKIIDGNELIRLMFQSKSDPSQDDTYNSMCRQCGEIVQHYLRSPKSVMCPNGHMIEPTLDADKLFAGSPLCIKCGTPMRLIRGRAGLFWGCSRYPNCRYTRSYGRSARSKRFRRRTYSPPARIYG